MFANIFKDTKIRRWLVTEYEINNTSINGKHYCVYANYCRKTIRATILIPWYDTHNYNLSTSEIETRGSNFKYGPGLCRKLKSSWIYLLRHSIKQTSTNNIKIYGQRLGIGWFKRKKEKAFNNYLPFKG